MIPDSGLEDSFMAIRWQRVYAMETHHVRIHCQSGNSWRTSSTHCTSSVQLWPFVSYKLVMNRMIHSINGPFIGRSAAERVDLGKLDRKNTGGFCRWIQGVPPNSHIQFWESQIRFKPKTSQDIPSMAESTKEWPCEILRDMGHNGSQSDHAHFAPSTTITTTFTTQIYPDFLSWCCATKLHTIAPESVWCSDDHDDHW